MTASETDEGRRLAESRINMLTGGDPVRARFMRQDLFEFTPQLKLVISGNRKPSLGSVVDDAGIRSACTMTRQRSRRAAMPKLLPSTASSGRAAMRLSSDARNPTTGRMIGLIANLELGRLNNQKPDGRRMAVAFNLTRARAPDNTLPYRPDPHHVVRP